MARCPDCGADNPEDAAFCGLCAGSFERNKDGPVKQAREKWSSIDELEFTGHKRRSRGFVLGACAFAVAAIAVIAGVLVGSHVEKTAEGCSEYVSRYSAISFKYPSSWEAKDFDCLRTMNRGEDLDPRMGNEVILMKRGRTVYRHLLIVSSVDSPYRDQSWSEVKNALETDEQQSGPDNRTDVTFIKLGMQASQNANGIGASYTVIPVMGPRLFQIEGMVLKDDILYTFAFTTPLKGGGSDEAEARAVFATLMQSVSFR